MILYSVVNKLGYSRIQIDSNIDGVDEEEKVCDNRNFNQNFQFDA